jgi:hypothetical protein
MKRRPMVVVGSALALLFAVTGSTALAADRNDDRIPDRWEKRHGLSLKVKQTRRDQDRDGVQNLTEYRSHTEPLDDDSDADGVEDGDEDRDDDSVDNYNEQDEGTRPDRSDTDGDGRSDGREDADHDGLQNRHEDDSANEPDDRDTDDDGIEDGEEQAGVISSFDGVTLVIEAFGNGELSGIVDGSTEIKCETEDEHEVEDESGDDSPRVARSDDDDLGDADNVCTVADLVAGTPVHEAEIEGGVYEEVELIK